MLLLKNPEQPDGTFLRHELNDANFHLVATLTITAVYSVMLP